MEEMLTVFQKTFSVPHSGYYDAFSPSSSFLLCFNSVTKIGYLLSYYIRFHLYSTWSKMRNRQNNFSEQQLMGTA